MTETTNGCDFTFTQPETAADVPVGSYTGKVDLFCPAGQAIVTHVYAFGSSTNKTHFGNVCTTNTFPKVGTEQELGGHVVYTPINAGPGERDDITVKLTIEGLHQTSNCPETPAESNAGIYKATITLKAFKHEPGGAQRDLWMSHP